MVIIKRISFLLMGALFSISLSSQEPAPITIEEAYVTYSTSNYFPLVEVLLDSVQAFSTRPIVVIGVNADIPFSKEKYPFMVTKRIDEDASTWSKCCFLKPKALLAAGVRNAVYVDADIVLNKGCDALFANCEKIGSFPLVPLHPTDIQTEKSIMEALGVKEKSMHYVHAAILVYSEKSIPFLQEWDNACVQYGHLVDHDEVVLNTLLWKYQLRDWYIKVCDP